MGDLHLKAARLAARAVNWNIAPQDIEDMRQEAALAIWLNLDKGENYAFVCGRNAALKWWRRYVMGWPRSDKPIEPTPASQAIKWPESEDGNSLAERHLAPDAGERDGLPDEIIITLVELFLEARVKRGKRGLNASIRDASIIALLCRGYNNVGIAQDLGIPVKHVQTYRRHIRAVLADVISIPQQEGQNDNQGL